MSRLDGLPEDEGQAHASGVASSSEGISSGGNGGAGGTSHSQPDPDDLGTGGVKEFSQPAPGFTKEQLASCRGYSDIRVRYWTEASIVGEHFDAATAPPDAPCYFCTSDCSDFLYQVSGACDATNSCVARHCLCESCQDPSDDGGDLCTCINSCMAAGDSMCRHAWDEFLSCEVRACLGVCGG